MARIKLTLPSHLNFQTRIPIRSNDINYGKHLGNDSVLNLIQEARVQFFFSLDVDEIRLSTPAFIMADVAIQFKSEGFYGQIIEINVGADEIGRCNFDLFYRLYNQDTKKVLAEAKTGMVCYDFTNKKTLSIPEELKKKLNQTTLR